MMTPPDPTAGRLSSIRCRPQPAILSTSMQAVLEQLERPLLCSSIRPEDQLSGALPDAAVLLDEFGPRGLDFVVDDGRKASAARVQH